MKRMTKLLSLMLAALMLVGMLPLGVWAAGETHTVRFNLNYNGAPKLSDQQVADGDYATQPEGVVRDGWHFSYWYVKRGNNQIEKFDLATTPITKDVTLYARWTEDTLSRAKKMAQGLELAKRMEEKEEPEEGEIYTVTFIANGDGVEKLPKPQKVKSGECAISPSKPARIGYVFVGWFLEATGNNEFDFSTKIKSNLSLYAKWEKNDTMPDDVTDPITTEIDENSKYFLSASEMDVLANSNTDVVFYVNTNVTVPYFELYCDGQATNVYLYDDGDYSSHHDDIPNDGCYTGVFNISFDIEKDYNFVAKASVGKDEIQTNDVEIFVYYVITTEQTAFMNDIELHVANIANGIITSNSDTHINDLLDTICAEVEKYLSAYTKQGLVSSVFFTRESYTYSWYYPTIGVGTHVIIYDDSPSSEIKGGATPSESRNPDSLTSNIISLANTNSSKSTSNTSKGNVIVLNIYGPQDSEHPDWNPTYDKIADKLENANFSVDRIYSFTCDDFKYLQKYNSLILLNSHGNTLNGLPSGKPMICTEEEQSESRNEHYSADIKHGRIERVTLVGNRQVYWVAPELFEEYYKNDKMFSPIVYLGCCRNYCQNPINTQMVNAIQNAGASTVLGYSASVYLTYDHAMITTIVDSLLENNTIGEALSEAWDKHGSADPREDDNAAWRRHAELNFVGSSTTKLTYFDLTNGEFDSLFNWIGDGLWGWSKEGDARSVFKLSGLTPRSFPKMAIISSGFGSKNDSTTSVLYQTFLVPNNATSITFSYDVVSEEPMEFVGSIYNDTFKVELLDNSGNILEVLAMESINTSKWYAVDGINFPDGDDTTYHTRWIEVTSKAISKYRGKAVTIRFTVEDAGDTIYDTAALIDSVIIR